jgi:O-succinylbenzoate synthase
VDLVTRAFRIPMRVPFRGLTERAGLLLQGPFGWAEFSPFPDHPPRLAAQWLAAAREAATIAWPLPVRASIPVNVTVPAVSPEEAHAIVVASGCTTAKVKVGIDDDYGRVEAARAALGPRGLIRIDVNGWWDVETAVASIRRLSRFDLEYVEQPVATLEDMKRLRARVDVPLAADESVRTADDPRHLDLKEAADVVVLKVHPLGGVWAALEIADALGLPAVVSSALETSIGLAAGVALAAALPELKHACGLGTARMLKTDVVADPLVPIAGEIEVRRPSIDEEALGACEIGEAEAAELIRRMRDAEQLLQATR